MSNADWGPPPDSANGPVLVVTQEVNRDIGRFFTGCRVMGNVDTGRGVDNQEQGAPVTLCSGTTRPWSALWPSLRRYY
jgi:hypothetical protein